MDINWSAVGAVGQLMAASATVWAVITALNKDKPKLRVGVYYAKRGIKDIEFLTVSVYNKGFIPVMSAEAFLQCPRSNEKDFFSGFSLGKIDPMEVYELTIITREQLREHGYDENRALDCVCVIFNVFNKCYRKTSYLNRFRRWWWLRYAKLKRPLV